MLIETVILFYVNFKDLCKFFFFFFNLCIKYYLYDVIIVLVDSICVYIGMICFLTTFSLQILHDF